MTATTPFRTSFPFFSAMVLAAAVIAAGGFSLGSSHQRRETAKTETDPQDQNADRAANPGNTNVADDEQAQAEAIWILFGTSPALSKRLISEEVLRWATLAFCTEQRDGVGTNITYQRGYFRGPELSSFFRCSAQSRAKALQELEARTQRGDLDATTVMAFVSYNRQSATVDTRQLRTWIEALVAAERPSGLYLNGIQYKYGRGLPINDRKAAYWLQRAANGDDIRAQVELCASELLDIVETYAWCSVAASNPVTGEGAEHARASASSRRETLTEKRLTASQLARGQRSAEEKYKRLEWARSSSHGR